MLEGLPGEIKKGIDTMNLSTLRGMQGEKSPPGVNFPLEGA